MWGINYHQSVDDEIQKLIETGDFELPAGIALSTLQYGQKNHIVKAVLSGKSTDFYDIMNHYCWNREDHTFSKLPATPTVSTAAETCVSTLAERGVSTLAERGVSTLAETGVSTLAETGVSIPAETNVSISGLSKEDITSRASLLFKKRFVEFVIEGKGRFEPLRYQRLFSPETPCVTMEDGIKYIQQEFFSLLMKCMVEAGCNICDRTYHFPEAWWSKNIHVLEVKKPGLFNLVANQEKEPASTVYDVSLDNVTDKREHQIGKLWKAKFKNYCDDQGIRSGNERMNKRKGDNILPLAGGMKKRRGRNLLDSYCEIGYLPGRDPIISDLSSLKSKQQISRLLRGAASHWKTCCPELFTEDNSALIKYAEWLFEPDVNNPDCFVHPFDFASLQPRLMNKLSLLVKVLKQLAVDTKLPFTTNVIVNDRNTPIEECLTRNHIGSQEEMEILTAIRWLGKFSTASRRVSSKTYTITVYPEMAGAGTTIHVRDDGEKLIYYVAVSNIFILPTFNIIDAITTYFLITMSANLPYHSGGELFGYFMEHFLFDRPQTGVIKSASLLAKYDCLRKKWNEVCTDLNLIDKLPVLYQNPEAKHS